MKLLNLKSSLVLTLSVLVVLMTSCKAVDNANNKQKGAAIGAAGGALLGAILGNNMGKGGKGELGALIGGVVGGGAGVLIGNKMDKQAKQIEQEIPGATVERVDDGIVLTFDDQSGVYFDTAQFNINAKSKETLDKLAGVFTEYKDTNILVVGHTDSQGNDANNMTLSKNRAEAVTNYLTGKGLASNRFTTRWYGEEQPKADNATAEGRSKNRRVNIAIIPDENMKKEAALEAGSN